MNDIEVPSWVPCTECGSPKIINHESFSSYFDGSTITCASCNKPENLWKTLKENLINKKDFMNLVFLVFGARTKIINVTMIPGQALSLNFSDYGIEQDAKILYINYTPQGGGLMPQEMHGNEPQKQRRRNILSIYPRVIGDVEPRETEVTIMVSWVSHEEDQVELNSLINAYEAYFNDEFERAVIPANTAMESALHKLCIKYLQKHKIGNSKATTFLENNATYSSQIEVLLSLIVSTENVPELDQEIRGLLNTLRQYRNDIAHRGHTAREVTKEKIGSMVCAVLFGLKYISHIEPYLDSSTVIDRTPSKSEKLN